jgi:hypothetical protein
MHRERDSVKESDKVNVLAMDGGVGAAGDVEENTNTLVRCYKESRTRESLGPCA